MTTCCIIPTYRERETICDVVRGALRYVDLVIVVDDACPDASGDLVKQTFRAHPSVQVIQRPKNGGVGAATKTGLERALDLAMDVIVKIYSDGQINTSYIPSIIELFVADPNLAFVKGNRFFDSRVSARCRPSGSSATRFSSLFSKFASGYWNVLDPTNGYLAFNGRLLPAVNWNGFADCYFFEISVLCEFRLKHAAIAEMEMETIYGDDPVLFRSPGRFLRFHPN